MCVFNCDGNHDTTLSSGTEIYHERVSAPTHYLLSIVHLCRLVQSNECIFSVSFTFLLISVRLIYFHKLSSMVPDLFLNNPF